MRLDMGLKMSCCSLYVVRNGTIEPICWYNNSHGLHYRIKDPAAFLRAFALGSLDVGEILLDELMPSHFKACTLFVQDYAIVRRSEFTRFAKDLLLTHLSCDKGSGYISHLVSIAVAVLREIEDTSVEGICVYPASECDNVWYTDTDTPYSLDEGKHFWVYERLAEIESGKG
jgi:hypothetical protein